MDSFRTYPLLWFILIFIPFANLYFVWKVAENIIGHEKRGEEYSHLDLREEAREAEFSGEPAHIVHREKGLSTKKWPALGLVLPLGVLSIILIDLLFPESTLPSSSLIIFTFLSGIVFLYLAWRMGDLISGHREKSESHELIHREEKGSTTEKFIMALFPLVNLLIFWEAAKIVAGHERISKE